MEDIRKQINSLSISEKILLVEEIWDSIANEELSFELSEKQKEAVEKRSKDFHNDPSMGRSWEEIKNEFLGKQ
ncbi:MAG: addiction module protein [Ignavibacteriaceae bacterium]